MFSGGASGDGFLRIRVVVLSDGASGDGFLRIRVVVLSDGASGDGFLRIRVVVFSGGAPGAGFSALGSLSFGRAKGLFEFVAEPSELTVVVSPVLADLDEELQEDLLAEELLHVFAGGLTDAFEFFALVTDDDPLL